MKPLAIVLSGNSCSGKTELARMLCGRIGLDHVSSSDLASACAAEKGRSSKERTGLEERLERATSGRWLADALAHRLVNTRDARSLVIDCVTTTAQVEYLRQSGWSVIHVHLEVSEHESTSRFHALQSARSETPRQRDSVVRSSLSQRSLRALRKLADVVIDTDRCSVEDVLIRVAARIDGGVRARAPIIDILVGGQYGSEGKGNIANYLAPEYDVLVRVGGPNAGHKVYVPNSSPYTFRQLPSGALANSEATLVIGAGAVISKEVILREIADLSVTYDKLIIDPQAMIIQREDIVWEERNLKSSIGSTAQGIGRATARKILYRIPEKVPLLAGSVPEFSRFIADTVDFFAQCASQGRRILLEGTQGTTLSLHHGYYPHVTSRATTAAACLAESGLPSTYVRRIVLVCRTYPIRVGFTDTGKSSGYMSREITFDEIARRSGIPRAEFGTTEVGSVSHRPRRVAEFDWSQLRRSLLLNSPTDIALTFADYFDIRNRDAFRYEQLSRETLEFVNELEKVSRLPVSLISTAFKERNIIDRRMW